VAAAKEADAHQRAMAHEGAGPPAAALQVRAAQLQICMGIRTE
jgi:hypothetical protein